MVSSVLITINVIDTKVRGKNDGEEKSDGEDAGKLDGSLCEGNLTLCQEVMHEMEMRKEASIVVVLVFFFMLVCMFTCCRYVPEYIMDKCEYCV